MVYQFLRALRLYEGEHFEESVTALDGAVAVALQFVRERLEWDASSRAATLERLAGRKDAAVLARLYELRCAFGAHPSCGKWWDFAELYEEEIDEFPAAVGRLIRSVATLETQHRKIERTPARWSQWFEQNCDVLWRSVWFDHVP